MRAVAVLCLTDLKAVDPHHDAIFGAGERRQDEKQYQSPELLFHFAPALRVQIWA